MLVGGIGIEPKELVTTGQPVDDLDVVITDPTILKFTSDVLGGTPAIIADVYPPANPGVVMWTMAGLKAGTTDIEIKSKSSGKVLYSYPVTVAESVFTNVKLNATNTAVTGSSSADTDVVVSTLTGQLATGKATIADGFNISLDPAVAEGTLIGVGNSDNSNVVYLTAPKATIEAPVLPTSITLSSVTATIDAGSMQAFTATVAPSNAADKTVTWSIADNTLATVSGGTVTAKNVMADGTTTLTVTSKADPSVTATAQITVKAPVASWKLQTSTDGDTFSDVTGGVLKLDKNVTFPSFIKIVDSATGDTPEDVITPSSDNDSILITDATPNAWQVDVSKVQTGVTGMFNFVSDKGTKLNVNFEIIDTATE